MRINNRTESTCGAVQDDTSEHSDSSKTPIQATLVLFSHPDGVFFFWFQLVSVPLKKLLKSKFLLGVNVPGQVLVCLVRGPANRPGVYPTFHPKSAGISSGSCDLAWISGD